MVAHSEATHKHRHIFNFSSTALTLVFKCLKPEITVNMLLKCIAFWEETNLQTPTHSHIM